MVAQTGFRARISGRVQGVGFRFFVLGAARRLGIAGNVRNLPDGAVQVEAAGTAEQLAELLEALRQGPPLSRVDDVAVEREAPIEAAGKFEILGS